MMNNWNGGWGWGGWVAMGLMMLIVWRSIVAVVVSVRAANLGSLVHELVVLPLSEAQHQGQRVVGSDGRVDETGSLGEASRTCGSARVTASTRDRSAGSLCSWRPEPTSSSAACPATTQPACTPRFTSADASVPSPRSHARHPSLGTYLGEANALRVA